MYSDLLLNVPLPSDELTVRAHGVVVHVHGQGEADQVESMTPADETIAVITVAEEQMEPSTSKCRVGGCRPVIEMFYNPKWRHDTVNRWQPAGHHLKMGPG